MGEPCGWAVTDDADTCCTGWADFDAAVQQRAATLAIAHLWAATGRRYGLCEVTVLPCNPPDPEPLYQTFPVAADTGGGGLLSPYIDTSGTWRNNGCGGGCRCAAACELELPPPVAGVIEVHVAGVLVDPDAYEVHDQHLLVRTDGGCWPTCNSPTPTVGMQVWYQRGEPIPDDVQAALDRLACEVAKACTGGPCALPQRMTRLARQGVEVAFAEGGADGDDWRTNIASVDQVIANSNPGHRVDRPLILSPDMPTWRTVTSVGGS